MNLRNLFFLLLAFLVLTSFAGAQFTAGFTLNGDSQGDLFGHTVSDAGDVNGDGITDIIAGAPDDDNKGIDSGSARIFSGLDGSILYTLDGDNPGDSFGFSVSGAGDVNSDGFADFIVGSRRADNNGNASGSARVFSGVDGSILYTFNGDSANDQLGYSVGCAEDVNGDGIPDVIVGAIGDDNNGNNSGSVRVFSGFDGSILYTFNGGGSGAIFGFSVNGAGDVNGDGFADVIAGGPQDADNGQFSGSAQVYSGCDGSLLYDFNGDNASDLFGWSVSGAGDVNGDGFSDFIVGAILDDDNGNDSGSARVFSGVDGTILHTFFGDDADDEFGSSVSSAKDVNGDGYADVVVGATGDGNNGINSGSARVLSGFDGAILTTLNGTDADDQFGNSVSGVCDLNGDGLMDLVVAAVGDDNNGIDSGSVQVFFADPSFALCRYQLDGDSGDNLGRSVSRAGDVNGDGHDDFIVGAHMDDNNGSESGSARVISGADNSLLYTFNGDDAFDHFGWSVSDAGDVNADGFDDLIVGARLDDNNGSNSGMARVFSGLDGSTLYTFEGDSAFDLFGCCVSSAGDVNGDGYGDVIVGAYLDDNNGTDTGNARVFSGLDGSVLYTFDGDDTADQFGRSVSGAGDVNGDGFDDVIVGAQLDDNNGTESGSVRVFSGFDGSVLYHFDGDSPLDRFGVSVSGAGDVNGDGYADFVVGAYWDDNNGSKSGSARVYSGFDGSILFTFNGEDASDELGTSVSDAGDVNGDGFADVIAGAPGADVNGAFSGSVHVFSGIDGHLLYTIRGAVAGSLFGFSVSGAGDVDADGAADFIVGAPLASTTFPNFGSAFVYKSSFEPEAASLGQAPQIGLAMLDINNATNARGLPVDSNVVISAANGPYATVVQPGAPITFRWTGVPNTGVICLFGPANDAVSSFPGIGQFDIGGVPVPPTDIPNLLGVFGDFNLAFSSFHHAQFFCGAAGEGYVTYLLSPLFIPGYLTRFQCVMNPNGMFYMSNAVDVTVL